MLARAPHDAALPPPTPEAERLARLIGPEAAFALIEAHGGVRIYVPGEVAPWMVDLLGADAAAALAGEYGRGYLAVPLGRVWRVLAYQARGMSYRAIARAVGCSESGVWRALDRYAVTNKQYDLFTRD